MASMLEIMKYGADWVNKEEEYIAQMEELDGDSIFWRFEDDQPAVRRAQPGGLPPRSGLSSRPGQHVLRSARLHDQHRGHRGPAGQSGRAAGEY